MAGRELVVAVAAEQAAEQAAATADSPEAGAADAKGDMAEPPGEPVKPLQIPAIWASPDRQLPAAVFWKCTPTDMVFSETLQKTISVSVPIRLCRAR